MSTLRRNLSRVQLSIGGDALERIKNGSATIIGLNACGTEIAKNLLLTSIGKLTIYDNNPVTLYDVGTNYYARLSDLEEQTPRSIAYKPRLLEQYPGCELNVYNGEITEEWLKEQNIVIFADIKSRDELENYAKYLRSIKKPYYVAYAMGPYFISFCDFNDKYTVYSRVSNPPATSIVQTVFTGTDGVRIQVTPTMQNSSGGYSGTDFSTGMRVSLSDVEGLPELNEIEEVEIEEIPREHMIRLLGVKTKGRFNNEKRGKGKVTEVRKSYKVDMKPFSETLVQPSTKDEPKRQEILDFFLKILTVNREKKINLELGKQIGYEDEEFIKAAAVSGFEFPPIAAFAGAVAAQDILKFISGTLQENDSQWIIQDFSFIINWDINDPPKLTNTRYDPIIAFIGNETYERMRNMKVVCAGVGAIGSEYVRCLSFFGPSKVILIDDDTIESSNLTRQFLFTEKDLNKKKAEVAGRILHELNSDIKEIKVHEKRISDENVGSLIDSDIDIVLSGVDMNEVRNILLSYSIFNKQIYVNSGLERASGQFSMAIPNKTCFCNKFGVSPRPEFKSCTIRNHPKTLSQTVQYSVEMFKKYFEIPTSNLGARKSMERIQKMESEKLFIYKFIVSEPETEDDLINWALNEFYNEVTKNIEDYIGKDNDPVSKRWNTTDQMPISMKFDVENKYHVQFIISLCKLKWLAHKGKIIDIDTSRIKELYAKFEPSARLSTNPGPQEMKAAIKRFTEQVELLKYDKDNEIHLDFIEGLSNTRAECYHITVGDRISIMSMSGNMAPTMATTTTATGSFPFICLPQAFCQKEGYVPKYTGCELCLAPFKLSKRRLVSPTVYRHLHKIDDPDKPITCWDYFVIDKDMEYEEIVKLIKSYDKNISEVEIKDAKTGGYEFTDEYESLYEYIKDGFNELPFYELSATCWRKGKIKREVTFPKIFVVINKKEE